MSEVFDMCRTIRNHSLHFTLNPDNCWESFDRKYTNVVNEKWYEIKFLNSDATAINEEIVTVPNDKGGIYLFVLKPDIVPGVHKYILYVGRVKYTANQNLRKRFREYVSDKRSDIENMRETWGRHLYIRYLPLVDNRTITDLEKELIRVIIPPCNSDYPGVLNKAMHAAF